MKKIVKKLLTAVLTFAMVIGIFASLEIPARAATDFQIIEVDRTISQQDLFSLVSDNEGLDYYDPDNIFYNILDAIIAGSFSNDCVIITNGYEDETFGYFAYYTDMDGFVYTTDEINSWITRFDINADNLKLYIVKYPQNNAPSENEDTSGNTNSSASPSSHCHSYSWVITQEATVEQDGIEEYKCSCGDVQEKNIIPASEFFVKQCYGTIKDAPAGGTISFDSKTQYTLSDYLIRKLAERNDVTVVITFEYQKTAYQMTIPAGVDYTALLSDEASFYGYFYFANAIGAVIEAL